MINTLPSIPLPMPSLVLTTLRNVKLPTSSGLTVKLRTKAFELFPEIARPLFKAIPLTWQSYVLLPLLENIFAQAIDEGDFDFLHNKWLAIEINDLALSWWLSFDGAKLIMANEAIANELMAKSKIADVTFAANGDDLLLIAGRKQDPDTLFFQRRLTISGDTELGLEVKNLIDGLDLDQLPKSINTVVNTLATWLNDPCLNDHNLQVATDEH